jgi:hypothetical protein
MMVVNQLYDCRAQPLGSSRRERGPHRKAEPAYGPFAAARQVEAEGIQQVREWLKRGLAPFIPQGQLPVCRLFAEDIEPGNGAVLLALHVVEPFAEHACPQLGATFAAIGW